MITAQERSSSPATSAKRPAGFNADVAKVRGAFCAVNVMAKDVPPAEGVGVIQHGRAANVAAPEVIPPASVLDAKGPVLCIVKSVRERGRSAADFAKGTEGSTVSRVTATDFLDAIRAGEPDSEIARRARAWGFGSLAGRRHPQC